MPFKLSSEQHEEIYQKIKHCFSDFALFESLVAKQLRKVISETNNVEIDVKTTRKITERYFDVEKFQTNQQKLLLTQIQLILKTTYVLILSYNPENQEEFTWKDIDTFIQNYPQYASEERQELDYLLNYRNYLRIALEIIPARLNKQLLLKIASRLEGSNNEYITGGGQKPCVTRRVEIYEREGNVARPTRRRDAKDEEAAESPDDVDAVKTLSKQKVSNSVNRKRPISHASLRDVKMIRLPSEEVRQLASGPADPFAAPSPSNLPNQHPPLLLSQNLSSSTSSTMPAPLSLSHLSSDSVMRSIEDILGMEESPNPLPLVGLGPTLHNPPAMSTADLIQSFPPTLQRAHSDVLDRLLSENSEFWTDVAGSETGPGAVPSLPLADQPPLPLSTLPPPPQAQQPQQYHISGSITVPTGGGGVSLPLQLLRTVSWDVYNGTFTEDLKALYNL
jgi:hypothetical protein